MSNEEAGPRKRWFLEIDALRLAIRQHGAISSAAGLLTAFVDHKLWAWAIFGYGIVMVLLGSLKRDTEEK